MQLSFLSSFKKPCKYVIFYQLTYTHCFPIFIILGGKNISTLVKINQSCQETK